MSFLTEPDVRQLCGEGAVSGRATHWAFDIGFLRVFLRHSSANTASCRVAEKTGFRYEGTLVSAAPHPDGRHDMHVHARIANHG